MTHPARQWQPSGPLAVDPSAIGAMMLWDEDEDESPREPGRIYVRGPLSETGWGGTYSGIRAELETAVASGVRPVVLVIDSPGGEVTGLRETVAAIEAARQHGPVLAYIQGAACSAAYWLAAACDRIIAADTARVGCVGAVISGLDMRGAYESKGARYYRWTSARTPGKSPEPGTPEMDAEAQRTVDSVGDAFLADLSRLRGPTGDLDMVADAYRRGASLPAADALGAGWVDEVITAGDTDHNWLLFAGDAPAQYRFPMAARAAADIPAGAGSGGLMPSTLAGAAGPTDVVTLSRADHAALMERATAAEGRTLELLAQLAEREAQTSTLTTRVETLESAARARDISDEIREAEAGGRVVTDQVRALLPRLAAEDRAIVLAGLALRAAPGGITPPQAGPIGHGGTVSEPTADELEIRAGQAAINAGLAARKGNAK